MTAEVIEWCERQNYFREGEVTEKELSQIMHYKFGNFFTSDGTLEQWTFAANAALYARIRPRI